MPTPVRDDGSTAPVDAKQQAIDTERCEQTRTSEKQRSASTAIALLIVGAPLYFYHWFQIKRDSEL